MSVASSSRPRWCGDWQTVAEELPSLRIGTATAALHTNPIIDAFAQIERKLVVCVCAHANVKARAAVVHESILSGAINLGAPQKYQHITSALVTLTTLTSHKSL